MSRPARRIGIVGYGKLGQHLCHSILNEPSLRQSHELAFVWNLDPDDIGDEIPEQLRLQDLNDFARCAPDLVVEVAHPCITWDYGTRLRLADAVAESVRRPVRGSS